LEEPPYLRLLSFLLRLPRRSYSRRRPPRRRLSSSFTKNAFVSFPREKQRLRDFSSASSFPAFRELLPFKLPFKLPRLLEKNALRLLMRERERLLFDSRARPFTRDVMDVHTTLLNAPLL